MNFEPLPHQKKVRLMGTLLAILSWIAIACLGLALILLFFFASHVDEALESLSLIPTGDQEMLLEEDFLPDGVTLDMTVGELIEADRSFLLENVGLFSIHGILIIFFYLAIAVIFLRIAFAWRRAEPFAQTTIMGLRWLGILLLTQCAVGFIYTLFAPESLTWLLTGSLMYDALLEGVIGNSVPNLESGILFLTLSWVLEHGQKITEEQKLTV